MVVFPPVMSLGRLFAHEQAFRLPPLLLPWFEPLRLRVLRRPVPLPLTFRAEPSTLFAVPSCTGWFAGLLNAFVYPLLLGNQLVPILRCGLPFELPLARITLFLLVR